MAIIAFGPGLLIARGASLGDAGFIVSLAIWLTMLSVPLGGLLTDRLGRPALSIVAGSLVAALVTMLLPALPHSLLAFCLVGLAIGAPPGALMALLPKAVAGERLATALGVHYTPYYVVMAVVQLAAGAVRDAFGKPGRPDPVRGAGHGRDDRRLRALPDRRADDGAPRVTNPSGRSPH